MEISERIVGDVIQLSVSGNVDTITAGELQQRVLLSFQKTKNLVLDIEGVAYMSSAGLRVLLSAQKTMNKQGSMIVKNPSEEVSEIFEVTGFSDIFTIQ